VLSYTIRRLLLMIPTLVGILIINFAILRLQSASLTQSMQQQVGNQEGASASHQVRSQASYSAIENHLARFVRTGNNLPALINVRGWLDKDDVVALLRQAASPTSKPSVRSQAQSTLWLLGHFGVEPLEEVIADDSLVDLHGQASVALTLDAYVPLNIEDLKYMSEQRQDDIRVRNGELRKYRFPAGRDDPDYAEKRAKLLALCERDKKEFAHTSAAAWGALLRETGICDFFYKLFSGNLYSETRGDYVFHLIGDRWYVTFWLNLFSIIIAWCGSLLIGIRSARTNGSLEERVATSSLFILWSVPSFFLGTLMLHHLCTNGADGRAWFPNRGLESDDSLWLTTPAFLWDLFYHACLPMTVLCYASFTSLSRYVRGNLLEQLQSDYVRSARAKGCNEDQVTYRHALPNSMITMITLGSGLLADLFGSSVIVETIFSIPGLGLLLFDAAKNQDGPLIMGSTVISVLLLLVGILIADLLYAVVDPRIRSKYA
jgi:peptide/nickel transport system permease protein